jgi:hypothetical protein
MQPFDRFVQSSAREARLLWMPTRQKLINNSGLGEGFSANEEIVPACMQGGNYLCLIRGQTPASVNDLDYRLDVLTKLIASEFVNCS